MNTYEKAFQKIKQDEHCKCNYTDQIFLLKTSGPTGPTGPAPNFWIGNVTTGAPGTEAVVTIKKV